MVALFSDVQEVDAKNVQFRLSEVFVLRTHTYSTNNIHRQPMLEEKSEQIPEFSLWRQWSTLQKIPLLL